MKSTEHKSIIERSDDSHNQHLKPIPSQGGGNNGGHIPPNWQYAHAAPEPHPQQFLLEGGNGVPMSQMIKALWFRRGTFATLALLFATFFVLANTYIFPDKYEAVATVRVKALGIDDNERTARSFSIVPTEVLSNRVLEKVITDLELTKRTKVPLIETGLLKLGITPANDPSDPSGLIRALKTNVRIVQERMGQATAVFSVSLRDKDPEVATKIVNAIVHTYIALRHTFESSDASEAVAFLEPKLAAAEQIFSAASEQLTKFNLENVDFLVPTQTIEENISRLQLEYTQSAHEMDRLSEVNKKLKVILNEEPRYITSANIGRVTSSLTEQLRVLESELINAESKYMPTHPHVVGLKDQLKEMRTAVNKLPKNRRISGRVSNPEYLRLRRDIESNAAEVIALERRLPSIEQNIVNLTGHLSHAKSAQSGLLTHQSEWDKAYNDLRLIRESFLEYKTQADAQSQEIGKDLNVLDAAAVPTLPISASRTTLMGLGLIAGFGIAFFIVFIKAALSKWEVPEVTQPGGLFTAVVLNLIGAAWIIALLGFIIATPYL